METFYFIATVANCNVNTIKIRVVCKNRAEALAIATKRMEIRNVDATLIQNCAEAQFIIPTVMDLEETFGGKLQVRVSPATRNPVFPI